MDDLNWIFTYVSGRNQAKLYNYLYSLATTENEVFPSYETIARVLGFQPQSTLSSLKRKGLIDWKPGKFNKDGKKSKPNIYTIIDPRTGLVVRPRINAIDYAHKEQEETIKWVNEQSDKLLPPKTKEHLIGWIRKKDILYNYEALKDDLNGLIDYFDKDMEMVWERIRQAYLKGWRKLYYADNKKAVEDKMKGNKEKRIVD